MTQDSVILWSHDDGDHIDGNLEYLEMTVDRDSMIITELLLRGYTIDNSATGDDAIEIDRETYLAILTAYRLKATNIGSGLEYREIDYREVA